MPMSSEQRNPREIMSLAETGAGSQEFTASSPSQEFIASSPRNCGGDEITESSSSYAFGNVETVANPPLARVDQVEFRPWSTFDAFEVGVGDNAAKNLAVNISHDGPLMDAKTWPVLSKPTRASLKPSPSDSQRTVADGSVSVAQVIGLASPSHNPNSTPNHVLDNRQEQVNGLTSLSHNPNSTPNHVTYNRQKSMRRGWGNRPEHPSPGIGIGSGLGSLPRNEHHSIRRGNGGPHPRDNASRYRRNHDWNFNNNFADKDTNLQRVHTGSFQGPPFPGQFILPNMPGRPVGPFIYHDVPAPVYSVPLYSGPGSYPGLYQDLYRPFHPIQAAPVTNPYFDSDLNAKILHQIEYYFSNDNLASTTHLRENMDAQGWVSIKLIAGFKKVVQLTYNIQLILDVLKVSDVVEVEGEKVRRRNDWQKWLLPPSFSGSTLSSSGSSEDMLSANLQRTGLDDVTVKHGTSEGIYRPSS